MSSKLFRAVVGLGISVGSAAAACDGEIEATPPTADAAPGGDASTPSPDAPAGSEEAAATDVQADEVDTTDVADAGDLDVANADAIVDAFCDFTWPTTKGAPKFPKCLDPSGVCLDSGGPMRCREALGPHQCVSGKPDIPSSCAVDAGQWECPVGTMSWDQCWCYGELGDGQVCSDPFAAAPDADAAADQ